MRRLLVEVLAGRLSPHAAAARVWEVDGDFPGKNTLAKSRARARVLVDLSLAVLGDLRRHHAGLGAPELAHGELVEGLRGVAERDLADRQEALLTIRGDVERNLGPEALVERALLVCGGRAPIL